MCYELYCSLREVDALSEQDKDKIVLDSEPVQLTYHGGVRKTRLPKRWFQRTDLKNFFAGHLEIRLIMDPKTREPHLEIALREDSNGQK